MKNIQKILLFSILFNNSNNSLQILPQKIVHISNGREFPKYWKKQNDQKCTNLHGHYFFKYLNNANVPEINPQMALT